MRLEAVPRCCLLLHVCFGCPMELILEIANAPSSLKSRHSMVRERVELHTSDHISCLSVVNITQDSDKNAKAPIWQRHSSSLCWHCCYGFTTTPCHLPYRRKDSRLYLTGNFCSWNCCKAYYVSNRRICSSTTLHTITLLALLTSHRPRVCRSDPALPHPVDCPCMDIRFGIPLPNPRESLQAFGGDMTIEEYRKNFYTIQSYDHLCRYVFHNNHVDQDCNNIIHTHARRRFTYALSMTTQQEQKRQTQTIEIQAPIPSIRSVHSRVNILNWSKCP